MNTKTKSAVPALTRGLKILEMLSQDPYEMNLSELSTNLDIPPASAWRILKVLAENEYINFDTKRHTYRLGFKLMVVGNGLLSGSHFRSQARDYLKKLANKTGETAEYDVRIRDQLVLIDQVIGHNAVYLYSHPGSVMPYFDATGPGKIYLAYTERKKVRRVIEKLGLPKLTSHTIQDFDRLEKELEKVKIDGYAVDIEEMREGVGRVAAPVFDKSNKIIACLAIACPAFRLKEHNKGHEYGQQVKDIAFEMTKEHVAI